MAETAIALATAIGSAASAAAPALTAISAAAGLVQFGLGVAGSLQQADSQRAAAAASEFTASQQLLSAQQESLRGRAQANQIRDTLVKTLATQNARYAAAGIQLDSGTPDVVATDTIAQAERETTILTTDAALRSAAQTGAAASSYGKSALLLDAADSTLVSGIGGAVAGLAGNALRIADRLPGTPTAPRLLTAGGGLAP